jgi:zinc/manganese transport system substrate-binding protein
MHHLFRKSFVLLLVIASQWAFPVVSFAAEKLPVTASFSILGDLVRVVGGERVSVTTLVGPDEDAHIFEPRAAHARDLMRARLLVINGLGFDLWAQKLVASAGYKGAVVVAAQGVQALSLSEQHATNQTRSDPHAWQDPTNVAIYVRNIRDALTKADPAGTAYFEKNYRAYLQELQMLDRWTQQQFAQLQPGQRKIITSHDAFGYFALRYKLQFLAPQGVSTDGEASAKDMAMLIRQIKREKIKALFLENMVSAKLLQQLSTEAGVRPGGTLYSDALSAPGQPGATYLQMMRHNTSLLALAMKQN